MTLSRYTKAPQQILFLSLLSWSLVMAPGCSGPPPKPKAPPTEVESKHKMVNPLEVGDEAEDGMQVEGTLGQLDQVSIQEGLAPRMTAVTACFNRRVARKPYLGGQVDLGFRVARDGALKKLTMTASSVGDYAVEQCIRQEMQKASFSRPRGGEAEFTYSLTFQGRYSPLVWDPGMVKDEINKNLEELLTKKEGRKKTTLSAPNGLVVTFYVNRRGRVTTAGLVAEDPIDEEFAAAFIENLKRIEFVDPQSRCAKVTYTW